MKPIDFGKPTAVLAAAPMVLALALSVQAGESGAQGSAARPIEETLVVPGAAMDRRRVPALPAAAVSERARTVSYSDLDLTNHAGVETLYSRLETAARGVCTPYEGPRNPTMYRDWKNCYRDAMDGAVQRVGDLNVQQYHVAKTGRGGHTGERLADR